MLLNRRHLIRVLGIGGVGAAVAPSLLASTPRAPQQAPTTGPYTLAPLPYDYTALEPHIDEQTMKLHHGRHHQAYVNNLNEALKKHPELEKRNLNDLLKDLPAVPEDIRTTVRNNGGGHANHALFWQIMGPGGGGQPTGPAAEALKSAFGSFDAFKKELSSAAARVFGSGWAWLVDAGGRLSIETTPNQDTPVMQGRRPILGLDVWEHAYYLKYQNRRAEYIEAWWNVVNWNEVNKRLKA